MSISRLYEQRLYVIVYLSLVYDAIITQILQHLMLCLCQCFYWITLSIIKRCQIYIRNHAPISCNFTSPNSSDPSWKRKFKTSTRSICNTSAIFKYCNKNAQTCVLTSCNRNWKPLFVICGSPVSLLFEKNIRIWTTIANKHSLDFTSFA